jgi:hypothetical protein
MVDGRLMTHQTGILGAGPHNSLTPIKVLKGMGWVLTKRGWILPSDPSVAPVPQPYGGGLKPQRS